MLTTDAHLEQTQSALALAEKALAAVRKKRDTLHPDWYQVMAGPAADMVRHLRRQIDEYIGLNDPLLKEAQEPQVETSTNGAGGASVELESAKST